MLLPSSFFLSLVRTWESWVLETARWWFDAVNYPDEVLKLLLAVVEFDAFFLFGSNGCKRGENR
jgi:hypothetical protein